ncbi:ATP-dependent acyl-CoA ligase [Actinomadura viridis]|uniref:Crotonobetaine/carnitine-CoA ligase n=1 Tax=Actinomadura viridis TaxID=58110 RepID=A0A931DI99_9ACTN|nr:AMP-binding protein [Actinomadura viridis]MBG6089098.1 crotonobetaine/carnitine-CoA ligase [Actinomadura viridis]
MADWVDAEQLTLLDLLDRRLAGDPDGPFLDCCGTPYTAAELDAASNRVANALAGLGVGHGSTVATMLENGPAAVLSWFAIHKLGAIAVPVNTALKGPLLRHQLADAAATVLVVQDDLASRPRDVLDTLGTVRHLVIVDGGASGGPGATGPGASGLGATGAVGRGKAAEHSWNDLLTAGDTRPDVLVRPSDLGTIVYTGGTTGPSKGCALSHNYHLSIARQIIASWGRTREDVVWSPLPLFHFNAISCMLTGTLISGGRAAFARRFSVSGFWPEIDRTGATIASLLGSLAVLVAKADDHPRARGSGRPGANTTLRLLTGAPMPPEIDQIYRDRFGIATFSNAYGNTEASLISWLPPGRPGRPGSAGIVNSEAFTVKIFDEDDREVPAGAEGEIVCRPRMPHVMFEGYWRRPEATVAAWRNLWFHTGDIGRIDEDGYLFFVDRKADYMRRRGENISSWELEKVFHQHPEVADVCVHAVASEVGEDEVKATVVLRKGASLTEEALCRWAIDRLPYFAVPRYFEFREELPISRTGRTTKNILRDEGAGPAAWDREAAGVTFERR